MANEITEDSLGEEVWVDIPEFDGWYQVSSYGRVKRLRKVHCNHGKRNIVEREHILSPCRDRKGYLQVIISNPDTGIRKHMKVHRLVASVFMDNPYGYNQVDHINRNKADNRLSNLRWCDNYTNANNRDAVAMLNVNGLSTTITEWAALTGIKRQTIYARLLRGWTPEQAITTRKLKVGEKLFYGKRNIDKG